MTSEQKPSEEALKLCPFCGACVYLNYNTKTGMFGPDAEHERGCIIANFDFCDFADEHDAIASWNSRVIGVRRDDPPLRTSCTMCDDTGYRDHYGYSMDMCDHTTALKARDEVGEPVAWLYQFTTPQGKVESPVYMTKKRDWAETQPASWTETPLYKRAVPDERAQIVKWLRDQLSAEYGEPAAIETEAWWFADAIERGDHLTKAPETTP